jgi:hypothetical protein
VGPSLAILRSWLTLGLAIAWTVRTLFWPTVGAIGTPLWLAIGTWPTVGTIGLALILCCLTAPLTLSMTDGLLIFSLAGIMESVAIVGT